MKKLLTIVTIDTGGRPSNHSIPVPVIGAIPVTAPPNSVTGVTVDIIDDIPSSLP